MINGLCWLGEELFFVLGFSGRYEGFTLLLDLTNYNDWGAKIFFVKGKGAGKDIHCIVRKMPYYLLIYYRISFISTFKTKMIIHRIIICVSSSRRLSYPLSLILLLLNQLFTELILLIFRFCSSNFCDGNCCRY